MKKATKTDWRIRPMPLKREILSFQREFTPEEYEKLQYGLIPQVMEDKWFIYFEEDKLYFYRSWSGICIYIVGLEKSQNQIYISKIWVNADKKQFKGYANEISVLEYLIDRLLLRKNIVPPGEYNPIELWSMFGRESLDIS